MSPTCSRFFSRVLVSAGVLGALGAVAALVPQWRADRSAVSPTLRTPATWVPFTNVPGAVAMTIAGLGRRAVMAQPTGDDVQASRLRVQSPEGVPCDVHVLVPESVDAAADAPDWGAIPVMVWTHGGGHLAGAPEMYDTRNAAIARALGAIIVAPYYPKAPANPFPADFDVCYAALRWAQERTSGPVAVCGDSAGGGLAAGLAQRAFDEGHPIVFNGLVYPMLDHRTGQRPVEGGRGHFVWTANFNRAAWAAYLGADHLDRELEPYASPVDRGDFTGMPPTWISIGTLDLFYDESRAYADKLRAAGVPVDFVEVPGAYHGFDALAPKSPETAQLTANLIAALRPYLRPESVEENT